MTDYFIGDIQGCYSGLQKALAVVEFNPSCDTLWLTGDLIARGEDSLATLKFLYKNQDHVKTVLGNHDLHFLAVANGLKKVNPKDNLAPLLNSSKLPKYLDWLRQQALIVRLPDKSGYMTHAGLAPNWKPKTAKNMAQVIHDQLTAINYQKFLPLMYGNKPDTWSEQLPELDKIRFSISAFTRMRFCDRNGRLNFNQKGAPANLSDNYKEQLIPWFQYEPQRFLKHKWIFGHWASLMGSTGNDNVIALDTGYVWGNHLTILDWQRQCKINVNAN